MTLFNIAVIGAGISGLCAAKHAKQLGFNVTIYEQNEWLGGIWHYTDKTGTDEYGINVHTAMYKGLRTNLPHQTMEFPDHRYQEGSAAYPTQAKVLEFIHSYADRFDLKKLIKSSHTVIRVKPIESGKWEVIVKDLPNNLFSANMFDAIFICNGHYATPRIPSSDSISNFQGNVLHSHDFRSAERFHGQKVLVIGAGPSGVDIVNLLSKTCKHVTFSQKMGKYGSEDAIKQRQSVLPSNCVLKDVVKRFTMTGAEFVDGTHETFTTIIWATGYDFAYPFLSVDCDIHVDDRFVQPLYKQVLNINHPTMAFIGIPSSCCTTQLFDLQVRFAYQFITGAKKLPTQAEMMNDMRIQTQIHWNKGYQKRNTHWLGEEQSDYFKQLSETADIENVPDVLPAMHYDSRMSMDKNPTDFRNYKYIVVNDKTFKKERIEE